MEPPVLLSPGGNESPGDSSINFSLSYTTQLEQDTIPFFSQSSETTMLPNSEPDATNPTTQPSVATSTSDQQQALPIETTHYLVPVATLAKVVNENITSYIVCKQNNRQLILFNVGVCNRIEIGV